jgi:hypothetical protein
MRVLHPESRYMYLGCRLRARSQWRAEEANGNTAKEPAAINHRSTSSQAEVRQYYARREPRIAAATAREGRPARDPDAATHCARARTFVVAMADARRHGPATAGPRGSILGEARFPA